VVVGVVDVDDEPDPPAALAIAAPPATRPAVAASAATAFIRRLMALTSFGWGHQVNAPLVCGS
jgi:hypothetical protein